MFNSVSTILKPNLCIHVLLELFSDYVLDPNKILETFVYGGALFPDPPLSKCKGVVMGTHKPLLQLA